MIRRLLNSSKHSEKDKQLIASLKNLLGFKPTKLSLYKQAFRHRSAAQEVKPGVKDSNERLEYLGDAILSAVVANYLFKKYPYKSEGFLTKMRSKIVSRESFSDLSKKLGLPTFIERQTTGKVSLNSIGGDAFEALVGAIYLDKGFELTQKFIEDRIIKIHLDLDEIENNDTDYKSQIVEWGQRNKKTLQFNVIKEEGGGHEKIYTIDLVADEKVLGQGVAFNKKKAEQLASEQALKLIKHPLN